ncbi:hypothetical wHTH DNA-binding protein [Alphaspiravirus yamagawaense]|uniref:Hypothetical wHTH DNA-binding protein n=1 Tax=Alphaspiravirus yamagawaense TaxID=1157339 RepID=J7QDH1_9VIRU|nr:hypothetical wHTH DNA-binding protein [Aeropyrum coil-shaped virus]CCG27856.1 hypothetical wHTH DNA-binding protein [Aeropyrum coil-shaped virus]
MDPELKPIIRLILLRLVEEPGARMKYRKLYRYVQEHAKKFGVSPTEAIYAAANLDLIVIEGDEVRLTEKGEKETFIIMGW